MIDYGRTGKGDVLEIVGFAAPGYAAVGDRVRVVHVGLDNIVVEDKAGRWAKFIGNRGASPVSVRREPYPPARRRWADGHTHRRNAVYSHRSPKDRGKWGMARNLRRRHQASRSNLSLGSKEGRLRATGPIERSLSGRHAGCTVSVFVHQSLPPSGPAPSGRMLWDLKSSNPTASSSLAVLHAVDVVTPPRP